MIRVNDKEHRGKYSNAHCGIFIPAHPEKYCGCQKPQYKSELERLFMSYCDKNGSVVKWGYETAAPVKYLDKSSNPPKIRRYFVDFVCVVRIGTQTKTLWVEIKPKQETTPPSKRANPKQLLLWIKNNCKWDAARKIAKSKGYDFRILTEDQLT